MKTAALETTYNLAKERYAELGVDTDEALGKLGKIAISMHCWQGDDVGGFERAGGLTGGGILATGNYPGRARTADELRADAEAAYRLMPGKHRFNLHAIYLDAGGRAVDRNQIEPAHFQAWIDWARGLGIGMDFNPTYFSHPLAASGFTLAHRDPAIRRFWVEHGIACRKIGAAIGRALGKPCVTNVWIPDGYKDVTIDRKGPRELLRQSLDEIFAAPVDENFNLDAVEVEAVRHRLGDLRGRLARVLPGLRRGQPKLLTLDSGHFHPTETIADKISAVLLYLGRDAAARQPRHPLGQRSRGDFQRRLAGHRRRGRPRGLSRPRPHRAGLLRRQHQSRGRLGDRHEGDD